MLTCTFSLALSYRLDIALPVPHCIRYIYHHLHAYDYFDVFLFDCLTILISRPYISTWCPYFIDVRFYLSWTLPHHTQHRLRRFHALSRTRRCSLLPAPSQELLSTHPRCSIFNALICLFLSAMGHSLMCAYLHNMPMNSMAQLPHNRMITT